MDTPQPVSPVLGTAPSPPEFAGRPAAIALFGTSADPPTQAHRQILTWLAPRFDHVAIWAADNPMKQDQTPLAHRMAMLTALVQELVQDTGLAADRVQVYPELSYPYTLVSVRHAHNRWPAGRFTLVLGSDLLTQLPRWYQVTELLPLVNVLLVPRCGYPLDPAGLTWLQDHCPQVDLAPMEVPDMSSRAFREEGRLAELTPRVWAYIQQTGLYGFPGLAGQPQQQALS